MERLTLGRRLPGRLCAGVALALLCVATALWACSGDRVRLLDVHDGRRLALAQAAPDLVAARLVVVGESHDAPGHHRLQLAVIRAMAKAGASLAVGVEMLPAAAQAALDDFLAGRMDEAAFKRVFDAHWGHGWELYREIFLTCREVGIPLVGLNVSRNLTGKVAREGFEALSPEERDGLPVASCQVDREYEAFLRRVAGDHGGTMDFRFFCEAQVVWDTAMAVHALKYLKAHDDRTLVVLCGTVHAWKRAMPHQVRQYAPDLPLRVILPEIPGRIEPATVGPGDCDYLATGF